MNEETARSLSPGKRRLLRTLCNVVGATCLLGSGLYIAIGSNKGLGVLALIISAIICRVLILDIALPLEAVDHDEE